MWRFERRRPAAGFLVCCLAAVLAGCGEDNRGLGSLGSPTLSGTGRSVPRIEGAWAYEATDAMNTCGAASFLFDEEGRLDLLLSNTKVAFAISGACDVHLAAGEGTALPGGALVLEYRRIVRVSERCVLTLAAEITGTVDFEQNGITGTHTLEVSGEGECGGSLPCEIGGTFAATRCPPGGCAPLECDPPVAD